MARNHAECRRIIEAFAEADVPLFVAFYRRRLPRFLKAKELVDSGRLGRVTMLNYRYSSNGLHGIDPGDLPWRLVAEHSGGGIFMDLACHALDIFDFILGPIESVRGAAANLASPYDVEDVVAMQCRFASGVLGVGAWNFASAASEDQIDIAGTEGRLTLSVFGNEPVRLATAAGVEQSDLPNPMHIQQPLIQSIVDQLHGRGQCPSTGVTAARTALVMDQVLADYYGGRDDAFWTRPEMWPGRRR
jgi:predicted dehydrogenase